MDPKLTILAESQITPHETLTVELVQPRDVPAYVRVVWPPQPTVLDPGQFGDSAGAIVKLFSAAHVTLSRIKSRHLR